MSCCLKDWSSPPFPCSMIVSSVERGHTLSSLGSYWEHGCPLPRLSRGCSLGGNAWLALKVLRYEKSFFRGKKPSSALATRSTRSAHLQLPLEDYLTSGATGFGNA